MQTTADLTLLSSCGPPSLGQQLWNICTSLLQKDAIAKLVAAMKEAHAAEPSTLFVIGSYHIGKERAFFSAAHALGFRIWCDPGKKKVGSCLLPSRCMLRPVWWRQSASLLWGALFQAPGTRQPPRRVLRGKCAEFKHPPVAVPAKLHLD